MTAVIFSNRIFLLYLERMFRSIIAFTLITAMLTVNFSRFFVYVGFEMNQNYIAAKLCENKDKPMLECKGKCYLKKKLKQAEEKENSQENVAKKNNFQEALVTERFRLDIPVIQLEGISLPKLSFHVSTYSSAIFQPPQV